MKKVIISISALALILILLPFLKGDLEVMDLNDDVRSKLGIQFMKLSDGTVHYDVTGPANGDVVVLVHGNAAPYFSWDKNVKALTDAGFRVVRYDLYGFGYSDRPDIVYSRELYDRQLLELLDKLAFKAPVNLVGTSQGGSIAVYFASKHPEKVKKLALISPFINVLPMKAAITLLKIPGIGDYLARIILDRINTNYPKKVFADTSSIPAEYLSQYLEQLKFRGFKRARLSNLRGDTLADFTRQYETVGKSAIPALLIWGTADIVIMADSIASIKKAMPGTAYSEIRGGGHLLHYEKPDPVNQVLTGFLK